MTKITELTSEWIWFTYSMYLHTSTLYVFSWYNLLRNILQTNVLFGKILCFISIRFVMKVYLVHCWFINVKITYLNFYQFYKYIYFGFSRICVCGYPRQHVRKYKGISSRIPVSSGFMVQMLTGIYFAL